MSEKREKTLEKTHGKGLPAVWEWGGGYRNTGWAQVVAQPDGSPPRPVYIRRSGELANSSHALFIAKEGMVLVEADHHRRDFTIEIWRIDKISMCQDGKWVAELSLIATFRKGEWDNEEVASTYADAISACVDKATCYHCREPHFIQE